MNANFVNHIRTYRATAPGVNTTCQWRATDLLYSVQYL